MLTVCTRLILSSLLALVMLAGIAYADAGTPTQAQQLAALWPMLSLAIGVLWSYGAHYAAGRWGWARTPLFHTFVTAVGVIGTGVTDFITQHGFTWAGAAWAAATALTTFIAGLSPASAGVTAAAAAKTPPGNRQAGRASLVLLMVIGALGFLFALASCGCAGVDAQAKANGITRAQQVLRDIEADAPQDVACLVALPAAIGAIYAGDLAAIASDVGCFYQAVKQIVVQLEAPKATPPSADALKQAQGAHALIKATRTQLPPAPAQ